MKQIPMRDGEKFSSKSVLRQVAEASPVKALTVGEMDQRLKIIRALDKANGTLSLEDAEHSILKSAVETYPWAIAHEELAQICHDVIDAKEPTT